MNDKQAANEILEANPNMLWRRATHADGKEFAVRFSTDGWEVLLFAAKEYGVSTWTAEHFWLRFTLVEYLDPKLSADLDRMLFRDHVRGALKTVAA